MNAPFSTLVGPLRALQAVIEAWDAALDRRRFGDIAPPRLIRLALLKDRETDPEMLRVAHVDHPSELGPALVAHMESLLRDLGLGDEVNVDGGFYLDPS